ncbi:MAG: PTS glucitol/sorbitol transporter subunit IIA [Gracilibacteraceae bacterium]|jgi:PTS system glucitol/sorbitol-specific IIA component|nr:PTS glucitol/sorbitol transporter subunit IIA [Gracilibacteraceae bacterium]
MNYKASITGIGEMALDFLDDNMIIVFNDNAPAELAEISVLHSIEPVSQDMKAGDILLIGSKEYKITAVGEEANRTFKTMGHCTFKFTGKTEVELPGQVEVEGEILPDIRVGDTLEIIYV